MTARRWIPRNNGAGWLESTFTTDAFPGTRPCCNIEAFFPASVSIPISFSYPHDPEDATHRLDVRLCRSRRIGKTKILGDPVPF
uniref:Uncharacterized protein n=1 Tax=Candidatus Kentrum sp. LFY TaxID=2126342 RepID=A0A450WX49_9GAMM|nr:MAG: hypothetical protein BECKLFY1418C_GA0070996_10979 [Candidatus Kentron sp. LFY]